MHTQAEKVCTTIFCLPATFFLDFVKTCVRPQGSVFPGLCVLWQKEDGGSASLSSWGGSVHSESRLGSSLLCQGLAFICIDYPHKCVWLGSFLFVYIIRWWGSSIESKICKLLTLTPTGFLNQPIVLFFFFLLLHLNGLRYALT